MFSLVVGICFAVAVVNAGFHHKLHHHHHHFTYDMNGFKGHHKDFSATFGPHPPMPVYGPPPNPPMPVYGPPPNVYPPKVYGPPPPPPSFNPHQHPHQNGYFPGFPDYGSGCPQNFGANLGFPNMMPFNPFQSSNIPFNPMNSMNSMNMFNTQDMDNFNHQFTSVNVPINILPPHSNGQDPSNVESNFPSPANLPVNPLPNSPSTIDVTTPIPLDANTVFANSNNVQTTTATNIIVPLNVDDHPQRPVNSPNAFEGKYFHFIAIYIYSTLIRMM